MRKEFKEDIYWNNLGSSGKILPLPKLQIGKEIDKEGRRMKQKARGRIEKETKKSLSEFYKLPVKKVMEWEVPVIEKSAPLGIVAKILRSRHHVWVVAEPESKKLVGIITEKEFLEVMSPLPARSWVVGVIKPKSWHHAKFERAEDLMVKHLVTCNQNQSIEEVLTLMSHHKLRRLAVIEEDELIGEVTLSALISAYTAKSEASE
jgi:CBS domain-containing protein